MRWHTVNYRKRDGASSAGGRASVGFWLHDIPRPLFWCRLFGHRPMVDGTGPHRPGLRASRWVECRRCGERPDPQGHLDPAVWNVGDRYTGPWRAALPGNPRLRRGAYEAMKRAEHYPPGPWPAKPRWTFGGQVVLFRRDPRIGFTVKVGNKASEQDLAADFHLPWLGSLYLHSERLGRGVVNRLNPVGYQSRETGINISDGWLTWRVWARRDEHSRTDPWWMYRSVRINPITLLLGPKRYEYTNVGDPVIERLRMPHGDDHPVRLQLQRREFGRRRGRKRQSWQVDCDMAPGVPTKPGGRGRIWGFGVPVSDACVVTDTWPMQAAVRAAERLTNDRCQNGWRPATVAAR